jgi:hypothetical protein
MRPHDGKRSWAPTSQKATAGSADPVTSLPATLGFPSSHSIGKLETSMLREIVTRAQQRVKFGQFRLKGKRRQA